MGDIVENLNTFKIMKIMNLTPHDLDMVDTGVTYPRTEVEPGRFLTVRAKEALETKGNVAGHVVSKTIFGQPYFCTVDAKGNDEQPFEGVVPTADYYVVSIISLQAIQANGGIEKVPLAAFLAPGQLVRDNKGNIVGSKGFSIL